MSLLQRIVGKDDERFGWLTPVPSGTGLLGRHERSIRRITPQGNTFRYCGISSTVGAEIIRESLGGLR
jgi:hypothetical protein